MNSLYLEMITKGCAVIALTGIAIYLVPIWYRLRVSSREISRFPLFEARRKLCLLVAEGKMDEEDEAWSATYKAISTMLDLKNRFNRLDLARRTTRVNRRIALDKRFAREHDLLVRRLIRAAETLPEYAAVLSDIYAGLLQMRDSRSHYVDVAAAWLWEAFDGLLNGKKRKTDRTCEVESPSRAVSNVSVVEAYAA